MSDFIISKRLVIKIKKMELYGILTQKNFNDVTYYENTDSCVPLNIEAVIM